MTIFHKRLKKASAALLGLGIACLGLASPAAAQSYAYYPVCDITDTETLYWETLGQEVVLTTRLSNEDGDLPRAQLSLTLADGTKIELGDGRKYLDEAHYEFSGCENHLEAAKSSTLGSLKAKPDDNRFDYILNFQDFEARLAMGQDCQFPADGPVRTRHEMSESCQRAADFLTNYNDYASGTGNEPWPEGLRDALIEQNAPFIYVTGSQYYAVIYVFDPIDNVLREIMTEGC